jgi:uncharacterized Zn-finger protein
MNLRLFDNGLLGINVTGRYGSARSFRRFQTAAAGLTMADHIVPHFHNDPGVPVIEIGAREFMCVGAKPPFDHPHVYCDMGGESEFICPYCSTLFRHNPALGPHAARPPECAWADLAA